MMTGKLFLLAVLFVVWALCLHMTALHYAARSAKLTARAIAAPAEAVELRTERSIVNRWNVVALLAGICSALLSIAFTALSRRANESAPRTIVVVLLVLYGILLFAAV